MGMVALYTNDIYDFLRPPTNDVTDIFRAQMSFLSLY